jgi:hypothetical protein
MLIGLEDAHAFVCEHFLSVQQAFGQQRRSEPRGEVSEPHNVALFGWDGGKMAHTSGQPSRQVP